jgi:phenylalanine-4-hydroxylase
MTWQPYRAFDQDYSRYTPQDQLVWATLFERQIKYLHQYASQSYLHALEHVGFNPHAIPRIQELTDTLQKATGFQLTVVPEIQPNDVFMGHLANRTFTTTAWLRSIDSLDYISEPDMFHDVFGHTPLLTEKAFADFFHQFGLLGQKYLDHAKAIELLGRVYWFTIEFGLIREAGQTKIYGAGLISSHGESKHCLSASVVHQPFDIAAVMARDYNNTVMQNHYFVLPSFDKLLDSLTDIEKIVQMAIN